MLFWCIIRSVFICLIYRLIKLLTPIVYPLVKDFRFKAREVVYSYAKRNNIYIYNMYPNKKLKDKYPKNKVLDYIRYSFYKFSVWIWLDDLLDYDIVDIKYLNKLHYMYNNKRFYDPIDMACSCALRSKNGDYKIYKEKDDYLFMLHNTNNNFKYMYLYSIDSDCGSFYFLNKRIGYIQENDDYKGFVTLLRIL